MKYKYLYLILNFFINNKTAFSQNEKVMAYFNEKGELSTIEDSYYFRTSTDTLNYYKSYYSENKYPYFEGQILNAKDSVDNGNAYKGLCIWYYKNGTKRSICNFNEKGVLHGITSKYYENGFPFQVIEYVNGQIKNNRYLEYDRTGKVINVLRDEFIGFTTSWDLIKAPEISCKMKIGGLEILNRSDIQVNQLAPFQIDSSCFSIETKVNSNYLIGTGKGGLLFNYQDENNYSYFLISKTRFFIGFVKDGRDTKQIDGYISKDLKPLSTNEFLVNYKNDTIRYCINGKLYAEIYRKLNLANNKLGFYASSFTNAFFDYLQVKQFNKGSCFEIIHYDDYLRYDNKNLIVQSVSNGLMIGSKGHILTSYSALKDINRIVVQAYVGDTIKQYYAEVLTMDLMHDLAILKIKDSIKQNFSPPNFTLFKAQNLNDLKGVSVTSYFKEESGNFSFKKFDATLASKADPLLFHDYFDVNVPFNKYINGSPVFTKRGEFLGIVIISRSNNSDIIKVTRPHVFETILVHIYDELEIKKKIQTDQEKFDSEIYKNIVLIKCL